MKKQVQAIKHKASVKLTVRRGGEKQTSSFGICDFCGREIACNRKTAYSVGHKTPFGWKPGFTARVKMLFDQVEIIE